MPVAPADARELDRAMGTAAVMRDYFSSRIRHYQAIAAGKVKPN